MVTLRNAKNVKNYQHWANTETKLIVHTLHYLLLEPNFEKTFKSNIKFTI